MSGIKPELLELPCCQWFIWAGDPKTLEFIAIVNTCFSSAEIQVLPVSFKTHQGTDVRRG